MGAYADAESLLAEIAPRLDGTRIGIGGYPEGHPAIAPDALTAALLAKQRLASVLVTQICFDAAAIVRWIRQVRAAGVTLPVLIGLPGVVDRRRLLALSTRVGVGASTRYLRKNLRNATVLLRRRAYRPDRLIEQLAAATADPGLGVAGLHLFTFNEVAATSAWRSTTNPRRNRDGR
jgi:methylenetetrahydrofolate reductase (NADPH)